MRYVATCAHYSFGSVAAAATAFQRAALGGTTTLPVPQILPLESPTRHLHACSAQLAPTQQEGLSSLQMTPAQCGYHALEGPQPLGLASRAAHVSMLFIPG
jgi:hypothetical protein